MFVILYRAIAYDGNKGVSDMQEARMLGNYIQHLAQEKDMSNSDLSRILGCTENRVYSFLKGRAFASFNQIQKLADALDISVDTLLTGDPKSYNASVVHCMNEFDDSSNREFILDLIDQYIDIYDAVQC